MHPSVLTCYTSPFPKIRLGKEYDGGYVIIDVPGVQYNTLLAGGIAGDITFEIDFLKKYPEAVCFAFDGTIDTLPGEHDRITFVKKNIGYENGETTNLSNLIENNGIFVKMDIEGGEIPWIKSLSEKQLNAFEQIVMEFHFPFSEDEMEVFQKINKHHYLVHFHGNNNCGMRLHNGLLIPNVFECTYLHKKHFSVFPLLNTYDIPSPLDMPNIKEHPDIFMNHPPFVNYNVHF